MEKTDSLESVGSTITWPSCCGVAFEESCTPRSVSDVPKLSTTSPGAQTPRPHRADALSPVAVTTAQSVGRPHRWHTAAATVPSTADGSAGGPPNLASVSPGIDPTKIGC